MAIALSTVVADAKEYVDETNSDFVPVTSWYRWLDQAIEELWRMYALYAPDAIETYTDFATTAAFPSVAIPANRGFRGVWKDPTLVSRMRIPYISSEAAPNAVGWYLQSLSIFVVGLTGNFRLRYLSAPKLFRTTLVSPPENETLDACLEQFVEFLSVRLAIKGAQKDENRRTVLEARIAELKQEIPQILAAQRSATPMAIIEVADEDPLGHWGMSSGRDSRYP